jgi:phosphoglucomutase
VCFGGEESAGASFLRRDGKVWTTDKDGIILGLLAAEITAVTGRDPGEHYRDLTDKYGQFFYTRIDNDCSPEQKAAFSKLVPEAVTAKLLAGNTIKAKLVRRQAFGHGSQVQALRRKLPERGASERNRS